MFPNRVEHSEGDEVINLETLGVEKEKYRKKEMRRRRLVINNMTAAFVYRIRNTLLLNRVIKYKKITFIINAMDLKPRSVIMNSVRFFLHRLLIISY